MRRNGTINVPDLASWFEPNEPGRPMWAPDLAPSFDDRAGLETTADIAADGLAPA